MNIALSVKGLGKSYRLRHLSSQKSRTFREDLIQLPRKLFDRSARSRQSVFWALREVDLDVSSGQVLGIIGRNGAGKSTLLKILSRVVRPTLGTVDIYGSVGSLLEVGSGFHPELTGRENIFLGGAMLGMRRAEIRNRFDEIVDFSGAGEFLDVPCKRYSSGMYTKLAFAVAAHLRTDILILDEVLAVGDSHFQQKCFGRIKDIAKQGRTILFVSHDLAAVRAYCPESVLLEAGAIRARGKTEAVIKHYLKTIPALQSGSAKFAASAHSKDARIVDFRIRVGGGNDQYVACGSMVTFLVEFETRKLLRDVSVGIGINSSQGTRLGTLYTRFTSGVLDANVGRHIASCLVEKLPLAAGEYVLSLHLAAGHDVIHHIDQFGSLQVHAADFYSSGLLPNHEQGSVLFTQVWKLTPA